MTVARITQEVAGRLREDLVPLRGPSLRHLTTVATTQALTATVVPRAPTVIGTVPIRLEVPITTLTRPMAHTIHTPRTEVTARIRPTARPTLTRPMEVPIRRTLAAFTLSPTPLG